MLNDLAKATKGLDGKKLAKHQLSYFWIVALSQQAMKSVKQRKLWKKDLVLLWKSTTPSTGPHSP